MATALIIIMLAVAVWVFYDQWLEINTPKPLSGKSKKKKKQSMTDEDIITAFLKLSDEKFEKLFFELMDSTGEYCENLFGRDCLTLMQLYGEAKNKRNL